MSEPTWENVLSRLKPWVRGRRDSAEKLDQAARHTSYDARVGAPSAKKRNDGVLLNSRSHRWSVQLAGRNNVTSRSFEEAANTSGPMGGAGVALFHQLQDLSQNLSPSEESLIEYISDSDAAAEDGNPRRKARHERDSIRMPRSRSQRRASSKFAAMALRDGHRAHPNDRDIDYFERLRQEGWD